MATNIGYCLTKVSRNRCRLKVTTEIRYKKSVWGIVKSRYSMYVNSIQL